MRPSAGAPARPGGGGDDTGPVVTVPFSHLVAIDPMTIPVDPVTLAGSMELKVEGDKVKLVKASLH